MSSESEAAAVRRVLDAFLDDLAGRLSTHELEAVLTGRRDDLGSGDLGNKPESFTESGLVFPLLEAVGLDPDPQPYGEAGGYGAWPDFELANLDADVIGESKPLNNVAEAHAEIKDYLDRKSLGAEYGIATDGIEWYVYKIELGGDFTAYPAVDDVSLRPALLALAESRGLVDSADRGDDSAEGERGGPAEEAISAFASLFAREAFDERLTRIEPRRLREERKRDVESFYDLYIELLFGEGTEFSYETCLLDDVRAPPGADRHDEQLFVINLVNRLLFVKFLETRGVLAEGFLRERVRHYEEHGDALGGDLYRTQIAPLFYELLNTPPEERSPKHRRPGSWFADVPYLNGGLFRESIADEHRYGVHDRILERVVDDLIEGSELELNGRGFDPAIVGSVFEKTINHVEQERTQKDVGAYYTPNDVTEIVVEGAVDPKIEAVLVEAFADAVASDDDEADRRRVRARMERMDLAAILRHVEDGEGWFGDPDAIRAAHERLGELTVLDPACGSGHFLTTAMDEIHRAQLSLLRGLNFGRDPDPAERYAAKVDLALDCIYGVDVDDVAAEIAKLRVWLKIVEGNGWHPRFGRLPNVDVNITDGNSLVGLPMTGSYDDADVWTEGVGEIEARRREYKAHDEGDPRELERFMAEEIRPALDERYLSLFTRPVETAVESRGAFEGIVETIDDGNLHPTFSSIQVKREDGAAITDEQADRLEDLGFTVHSKSARMDVGEVESKLKRRTMGHHFDGLVADLGDLFDDGFYFASAERRPTQYDLDRVLGTPFHWIAEFPEVAEEKGGRRAIEFDVILGNPPYGNLLDDAEETFVSNFATKRFNEISANFVERQLQLLEETGCFGNVTTLKLVYKSSMGPVHDLLRENLRTTEIACFAKRPSKVFEGAEVRVAIIAGQMDATDADGRLRTSEFVRFENDVDREERFQDIQYRDVEGFDLRTDGIDGDDRHVAIPKIGLEPIERVLAELRDHETLVGDRERDDETPHVVWRRRGMDYFTNPMLEKLYDGTDVKPLYFADELERRATFLALSSSIFYVYWCVYGDMFHLNLGEIRAFPVPERDLLAAHETEIRELSDRLWETMEAGFDPATDTFGNYANQKPIIEEADELLGRLYGLSDEEIAFVQGYHSEYGRHGPEDE